MNKSAAGPFDVTVKSATDNEHDEDPGVQRMLLEKKFHGYLEAVSRGQMLSFATETNGSAGYVAIEKVSGTLHGRAGSFALQHSGTMTRGAPALSISVVPDSGTGQLLGISGSMEIIVENGNHSYKFTYAIPERS